MNQRELYLPINQTLLPRPRVDGLLEKSLDAQFVAVVAGTGYGKTHALADFISGHECDLIWLHLGKLDNMKEHFWHSLTAAARVELPNLTALLETTGFPSTPANLESFLDQIGNLPIPHGKLIFVVDETQLITNPSILHFFSQVLRRTADRTTLVLCATSHTPIQQIEKLSGVSPLMIGPEELRFTDGETRTLMEQNGVTLSDGEISRIQGRTGGWPLAVYLIGTQLRFDPRAIGDTHWLDLSLVDKVLEQDYYEAYEPDFRKLLIKLSHLPFFRPATVEALAGTAAERFAPLLTDNMFVFYDHQLDVYFFQNMYQSFLQSRDFLIAADEKRQFYTTAADWFRKAGYELETVDLYRKAGMYDEMIRVIAGFTTAGMPPMLAGYLLDHLESLPKKTYDVHPLVEYLKAAIHLNNMEISTADEMLRTLAGHLEENPAPTEQESVLGEVYLTLGTLCLIQNSDQFVGYFEKAARCLKEGSQIKKQNQMLVGNNDIFFLSRPVPGERERMEELFQAAQPHILKAYNGGGAGYAELFRAESAYYTGAFDKALEYAFHAYDKARTADQFDIVYNARYVKARVALMQGDYHEMASQIGRICGDVAERKLAGFFELRDSALGWFHTKLNDLDQMPAWILNLTEDKASRAPIDIDRVHVLYANYLIRKEDFHGLIHHLEPLEEHYKNRGHWVSLLNVHLMRAFGYMKTGYEDSALASLLCTYEMCRHNGIITPFVEGASLTCSLLDLAAARRLPIEDEWMAQTRERAAIYAQTLQKVGAQHRAVQNGKGAAPPLTQCEADIFRMYAQELEPHEIAAHYGVSEATIRHLAQNVCVTLGTQDVAGALQMIQMPKIPG